MSPLTFLLALVPISRVITTNFQDLLPGGADRPLSSACWVPDLSEPAVSRHAGRCCQAVTARHERGDHLRNQVAGQSCAPPPELVPGLFHTATSAPRRG